MKDTIKIGDLLFFNWDNPLAKFILYRNKKLYGVEGYSHVAIVTDRIVENNEVYFTLHEAVAKGFVSSNYHSDFLNTKYQEGKMAILRSKVTLKDLKVNFDKYLGQKYSWISLFFIFINSYLKAKLINKIPDSEGLFCSEVIAKGLYDCSNKKIQLGYSVPEEDKSEWGIPYWFIEPMHIYMSKHFKMVTP